MRAWTASPPRRRIDAVLDAAGNTVPRLHHGFNHMTWPIIENAFRTGRDVRAGIEDTRVLPDGAIPNDNAHLVATAVEIARRNGREPIRVA